MKHLFLAIATLLLASFVVAQKVDLDPLYSTVVFKSLPIEPLGEEFKTYSIFVSIDDITQQYYPKYLVNDKINLHGFKKINGMKEKPDIQIRLNAANFKITKTEVKSRVEETKDKSGKVTSTKTYYKLNIAHSFDASYEVVNLKENKTLIKTSLTNNTINIYNTQEYNNKNSLMEYYKLNQNLIIKEIITGRFTSFYSLINDKINLFYGFPNKKETVKLWVLDTKKHPEYEEHQKNLNGLKELYTTFNPNEPLDGIKENAKPYIDYLNGLLNKYTSEEKPDKKMRYSAFYNLGMLYLYLDMPDEAIEMGDKLIINDYDKGDGKSIIKNAEELKALFEKNKIYTRHFVRDLGDNPEVVESSEGTNPSNTIEEPVENPSNN
jgi:hypothetical protein